MRYAITFDQQWLIHRRTKMSREAFNRNDDKSKVELERLKTPTFEKALEVGVRHQRGSCQSRYPFNKIKKNLFNSLYLWLVGVDSPTWMTSDMQKRLTFLAVFSNDACLFSYVKQTTL